MQNKSFLTKTRWLVTILLLSLGIGQMWGATTTLAGWTFTSGTAGTNYPSNTTNFTATTGTMTTNSTFYLNGSGSTWNASKSTYAFTAVTDITITLTLTQAVPAGTVFTLSAATYYNKASNAPMKGFSIKAKEGSGSFATTGVGTTSWSLSTSSADKTTTYTTQAALASGTAIAFQLTGTGKAGSGQGYMNNITITATTYSVTYNGNNNTGGSVPTDNVKYITGTTVTVKANSGSLVRTNYTFGGWNTNSTGDGTNYTAGSGTFAITADKTLYAKWTSAGTSVSLSKAATTNGSITLSPASSVTTSSDADVTVTAEPDPGYYLSNLTATNPTTGTATVAADFSKVTYSSGASGSSTITATFSPIWELGYGEWGGSWGDPVAMTVADGVASCSVSLSAMTKYGFKFHNAQTNTWYGNNGMIITDITNWQFGTSGIYDTNCRLFTGPAGSYTFSINTSNAKANLSYPSSVSHPSAGYAYFKKQGSDTYIKVYTHHNDAACEVADWNNSVEVTNTTSICNNDYFYFALTDAGGCSKAIIRYNNASSQKGDFTITSGAYSGKWGSVDDTNWHEFTSYTITFAGNGSDGGSMSNVTCISSGSNETLAANGFTKTDYTFTGWKADVAVTIGGSSVPAGTLIPDESTIQNITSNITLTAQWSVVQDRFIDALQNTSGYTEANPHTETGSYSTPSLTDKSVATSGTCEQQHYHFVGWITAAKYAAGTAISDGDLQTPTSATNATYYAVWAKGSGSGSASYKKVTSTAGITSDGRYLIVCEGAEADGKTPAFKGSLSTLDAARDTIQVAISSSKIAVTTATEANEFSVDALNLYVYAGSKYINKTDWNNGLSQYGSSDTERVLHSISIDGSSNFVVEGTGHSGSDYVQLKYNSNSDQCRFRFFKSGQKAVQLYKYDAGVTYTDYKAACEAETCGVPTGMSSGTPTAYGTTISWTAPSVGTPTKYQYCVWADGETAPTSGFSETNTTSASVTSLTSNTTYHWKVRSYCGENDESYWSADQTFTTTGVTLSFSVPSGVSAVSSQSSSAALVAPSPTAVPAACGSCWAFVGWTPSSTYTHGTSKFFAVGDYAHLTQAEGTTLYAVYGRGNRYKMIGTIEEMTPNDYYIFSYANSGESHVLSNTIIHDYFASSEVVTIETVGGDAFINNPTQSMLWKFTGTTSSGLLYNEAGNKYVDLADEENGTTIATTTSDHVNITLLDPVTKQFDIASTTTSTNYLYRFTYTQDESVKFWGIDDEHSIGTDYSAYIFKRSYSSYSTSPECGSYNVTWNVEGIAQQTDNDVSTCAGIQSLTPPSVEDDDLSCATTTTVFMGWSSHDIGSAEGQSAPPDLFTDVADAPALTNATKALHAVFATRAVDGEPESKYQEITISNFTEITTSYTTTYTHTYAFPSSGATTQNINVEAYGVYRNANGIQMNSGKGTYIKNLAALPGAITKIEMTWTASGKNSPTIYVAKNGVASSSSVSLGTMSNSVTSHTIDVDADDNYRYFYFDGTTVTGACYMSSLKITYQVASYVYSNYITSCCARLAINLAGTPAGTLTGGQIATNVPNACPEEEVSLIVAATNTGYNFGSWSVTGHTSGNTIAVTDGKFEMPNEQVDVTATFVTAHTTTVTLDPQGGAGGTASVTATVNLPMPEATMPTKEGYTFDGYYSAPMGSGTQYYSSVGSSAHNWDNNTGDDATLYANWLAAPYAVIFNNQSATTAGTTSVSVTYGTNNNLTGAITCPTKTDYTFGGYFTATNGGGTQLIDADGNWIPSVDTYTGSNKQWLYAGDLELYAKWTAVSYTNYRTTCGPEIEINGTVKLTTYANTEVLTPYNALITISSENWQTSVAKALKITYKDVANNVTYARSGATPYTQSEFRLYNAEGTNKADGSNITITGSTLSFRIGYKPTAGSYNTLDHYQIVVEVLDANNKEITMATLDLYGRTLPEQFVIATKKDGVWYALPNDLAKTEAAAKAAEAVEILVDNETTPTTVQYAPANTLYKATGHYTGPAEASRNKSGVRFTKNGSQYLQISTVPETNLLWLSTTGGTDVQDWYLNSSDFSVYSVKIDPRAGSTGYLAKTFGMYGSHFGFYSTPTSADIYLLPVEKVLAEAEVVEWGVHNAIVEVDANGISATQVILRIDDEATTPLAISQTLTSKNSGATKYNWTINAGSAFDFTEQKDKKLYLDWLNSSGTVVGTSMIHIPWIIDGAKTMATIDATKSHWEKAEVHVLNDATLTANGGSFESSAVTIDHLEIYPGATVKVTTGTVNTTNLVLRYGWTRTNGKAFDYARMYIASEANLTHSSGNAYADWYIDYDQYYPMAIPWSVTTNKISYKNTNSAASAGVMIRWYDGNNRASEGQASVGQNWKAYTWGDGGTIPSTLAPGNGYAMTAKRPTGKAFSIVRMPLTFTNAWTAGGEKGAVDDKNKNKVPVYAYGVGDNDNPWYILGWNFIANPYMCTFGGGGIDGSLIDQEGKSIRYVTKPDEDFQNYDQTPVADASLEPARGFFVQVATTGDVTFKQTGIVPPSAPARFMTVDEALPEQEAYISLSYEGGKDQMGLIIGDEYTAEYEVNADLAKVLGEGNFVKTYMNYGGMDLAYLAINATLAKEWIPVTVKIPANGEYTFSLTNSSIVDELDGVFLIDYANGNVITNLIGNDYVFTAEEGTITDRFAINATYGGRETPTLIDAVQSGAIDSDKPIKFLFHEKVYILYQGVIYDAVGKKVSEINK